MGYYQTVACCYPLPGKATNQMGKFFQTKDLEQYAAMDAFTITEEGRLIQHQTAWEEVPEEERPYYGKPEWENPLFRLMGCVREIRLGDIDTNHHGDIRIYRGGADEWIEYRVRFTEGVVTSVALIEEKAPSDNNNDN